MITDPRRLLPEKGTTDCACDRCRKACHNQPGIFAPGEAMHAAALLGLPFMIFKRRYLRVLAHVEHPDCLHGGAVAAYVPRKVHEPEGGTMLTFAEPFVGGRCVFLTEDERCGIHAAKPAECAAGYSCHGASEEDPAYGSRIRRAILKQWIDAGNPLLPKEGPPKPTLADVFEGFLAMLDDALREEDLDA